jgi:hypothetical protein
MKIYNPQPFDTSRIELSLDLQKLTELLARNTHDIWAAARLADGWRYGKARNDQLKQHPCLVPYEDLSESDKEYDRNTALETLKVIKLLNFDIIKTQKNNSVNKAYQSWTKEEFLVYLMLYAANADGKITEKQKKTMMAKAGHDVYERMSEQFAADNDYESLQNIITYKELYFSVEQIIDELKKIFFLDNVLSNYEQHILYLINKILNN